MQRLIVSLDIRVFHEIKCLKCIAPFVYILYVVLFHMCHQATWTRWCMITLIAFIWLISTMCIHTCVLRTLGCEHANLYWLHLFGLSNVLLNGHVEKMHSCIVGCVYSMCLFMCSNLCDTTLKLRSCYLNAFLCICL